MDSEKQEQTDSESSELLQRFHDASYVSYEEEQADNHIEIEMTIENSAQEKECGTDFEMLMTPDNTSEELNECNRVVLKPYRVFLKVIGWERMWDSAPPCCNVLLNYAYPAITAVILAATLTTQILTCFFRTTAANYRIGNVSSNSHLLITCSDHIVTIEVVPCIIILTAYLYGVSIFRSGDQKLASLMQKVFLSYGQEKSREKKTIVRVLRLYLVLGSIWIIVDFLFNIMRIFSLRLLELETFNPTLRVPPGQYYTSSTLHTTGENILRYVLVLFSLFGFVIFDLLYFATLVTYASQSQLIRYYMKRVKEKTRANVYSSLKDAINDIHQSFKYLKDINRKISILTSLVLFLFLDSVILSIYNLSQFPERDTIQNDRVFYVGVIVGILNILQWTLLAAVPLFQATRLTSRCQQLKRLGLEIGSNQLIMEKKKQEMDYFVLYTNATKYTAKLACVPMYPALVVGAIFLGGFIGSFVIAFNNYFKFATWF